MNQNVKGHIFGIAAVLLWSTAGTAFKLSLRITDAMSLVVYSAVFSFVVFAAAVFFRGRVDELRKLSVKNYIRSAFLGLLNPFLYYCILFAAYDRLLAQEALVLNYTWPIVLVVLSSFAARTFPGVKTVIAFGISFSGAVLVAAGDSIGSFRFDDPLGVSLAAGSSILWAFYWLINKQDKTSASVRMFLNFGFGSIYSLILLIVIGRLRIPSAGVMLGAGYIGLFEMGLTFLLWLSALRLVDTPVRISNLVFISPFLSLVWIHLVVGEPLFVTTMLGLVFIVTGIIVQKVSPSLLRSGKTPQ